MTPQRKRQQMALLAQLMSSEVDTFNRDLLFLRDAKRAKLQELAIITGRLCDINRQLGVQGENRRCSRPFRMTPLRCMHLTADACCCTTAMTSSQPHCFGDEMLCALIITLG